MSKDAETEEENNNKQIKEENNNKQIEEENNDKQIDEDMEEEINGSRGGFATNSVKEIDEGNKDANKEEIEEEIKEVIKEDVRKDVEEGIDPTQKSNKKIKIMDERTDEGKTAETIVLATKEITNGVKLSCSHPVVIKHLCAKCGELVEESGTGVAFSYIHPDMRLEVSELERLQKDSQKRILKDKKLILVLDLDFTLLNSVSMDDLTEEEEYLLDQDYESSSDDLSLLPDTCTMTKLRPFVHKFLYEASEMFEMYISTMGTQGYALKVAELLDPDGVYFPSRVICRSDHSNLNKKGLDIVLGLENIIIILDDTEKVWKDHKENLIIVEKYYYFAHHTDKELGSDWKSLSVLKRDERESDGTLASILHVLKRVHKLFYDSTAGVDPASRDVRQILASIKKDVLLGCNIVFSGVFPSDVYPAKQQLWKLAEGMGARCFTDVNDSVTHVVAVDPTTMEADWARDNSKFFITTRWVKAAHYLWRRPKEEDFPLPAIHID